jgi:hypothetical protein
MSLEHNACMGRWNKKDLTWSASTTIVAVFGLIGTLILAKIVM